MAPVARAPGLQTAARSLGGGKASLFRTTRRRMHSPMSSDSSPETAGPGTGDAGFSPEISCGDAGFGRTISTTSTLGPELICGDEGFIRTTSTSSTLATEWECLEESPATRPGLEEEEEVLLPDLPRIGEEDAMALLSELCSRYSRPEFQIKLVGAFCGTDPRGAAYCKQLTALLRPTRDALLAEYGFPQGEPGDIALAIALGEHHDNLDIQLLLAGIDEQLYGAEAPLVENSEMLSKKQVIAACRAQIVAFSEPSFRTNLRYTKSSARRELVLLEQIPILESFGLEPNERGAHSFLNQFAQYIMHPDVAAYGIAVNTLLGMGPQECQCFLERLQQTSVQHPCPRAVNPLIQLEAAYQQYVESWEPFIDKNGERTIYTGACWYRSVFEVKYAARAAAA